jgi:hypothetical protein
MEKICWTDRVRNEVLHRVKEERNVLRTIKRRANWLGHILHRNCLLKHIIEVKVKGRIEVTGTGGRRRKQLLDDLVETLPLEQQLQHTTGSFSDNTLQSSSQQHDNYTLQSL